MRYMWILSIGILSMISCSSKGQSDEEKPAAEVRKYSRFNGNYNRTFADLQDVQIEAAMANGVGPLVSRADTALYEGQLVRIPSELDIYKVDKLKHSMPFLVPKAATLLSDICLNFRDSLISKKMVLYKPIVTSITRTDDDVKGLSRRNRNTSDNSTHRYATTFDIAWTRFEKVNPSDPRTLDDGRLKAVLGQVLHDLRQRDRCYVKHERKQSCFHITVR
ncbi:MAG: DUF5715 family protein [Prevotella sp.]|uniref:DUF5715 family protein n=2 Tax=Dysgonomonas sp. TaxID=1891233 RepID=UPI00281EF124|nr:DUF5715 family protein [Dysgonomonas sp.]MDR1716643.1 DUF5715 family protein [Prevotella sp.]MDR2001663.1 DUF5715 family protein [Prevotella sp.]HMM04243.1 DUF5715 family protein [Dysgonomonas sp.]